MAVKWTAILAFAGLGIFCVAGNDCNTTFVSPCYHNLAHYEGLGFPLYGEDEIELDETCKMINDSYECVNSYVAACHEQPECDDECKEIIADIGLFGLNSGLRDLQSELCNPESAMRLTYLENYVCLEDNADHYASCHNDSQISQEFMSHITDVHESVKARCCYASWYQDCFTNITRDSCGVNATFFVSFSLHKLVGHLAQRLCKNNPVVCERPPLPHEDALDKDKPDETNNDIDNFLDDGSSANTTFFAFSISYIFIALCCVSLSEAA